MGSIKRRRIAGTRTMVLALATLAFAVLAIVVIAGAGEAAANLKVVSSDIVPAASEPTQGTTTTVTVTIQNTGDANATGFYVKLTDVTASKVIGTLGTYNLSATSSMDVVFTWDLTGASAGKHTLRAIADSSGEVTESSEEDNSADKDVNVNKPPVANAGASTSEALSLVSIRFSASGSSDPDGTISTYLWYFGDGQVSTGFNVTHSYDDGAASPGMTYNVTLVVADNDGGVSSDTLTVRILNRAPDAIAEGATIETVTPYSLSGSGSKDDDGNVVRFRWTLHNGTVLWGSPVVVSYDDDGTYGATLTVWDDDGATDSTSIVFVVLNQAPVVDLKTNRTLIAAGDSIHFDATGSKDVDGTITNYTWIFGDKTTGKDETVDHTYADNGSYNVTLVLVDDDGAVSHDTVRVIVGNSPPVAVAHANTAYVLTYEDVEFNATTSSDVDDNIATYAWDYGDGNSAMGSVVTHNFTDDGTYVVTVTVTDTGGAFGTSQVTVVVGNRAPVAAFIDLEVMTGEPAELNGSMCTDRDGYIASYLWDLGEGLVYTTPNPTHSWEFPGVYNVLLKVWDDDGATNETTFNVTVMNRAPVAVMTASPLKTTLSVPVAFNGTGSYDPDGEITNWTWSFGDGVRGYGDEMEHIYNAYGTYLATLTVRDDMGGINTTTLLITVRNQPPVADLEVTPTIAMTGDLITFDGSNSSDPENQIAEYFWSFGDGESGTGPQVTHAYHDDGWYTVRLTVVDQDSTASFVEVLVKIVNRAPEAKGEATPTEVKTLEEVSFTGLASKDDDGSVLWYRWDFGDGSVAYGPDVAHVFLDDGEYTVTLTVTDDDGSEASTTLTVTVVNRAPFSVAGTNQTTRTGIPVRLDGRASSDLDGQVVHFDWDFGDESTASGPVVTHSFPSPGNYLVWLTVTDDDGATATGNMTVTVENVEPVARLTGNLRVLSGDPVELDATSSYDIDGNIVDQTWTMGDGKTMMGPLVSYVYDNVGTYIVTLTVEDELGLTASIEVTVEVLNRLPRALISVSDEVLPTGETLELVGTGSSDSDGSVTMYTWILGDGAVAYGARVNHIYDDDGIFMVVLTVTDNDGGTDSTSKFIQIENRQPLPAIDGADSTLTLMEMVFSSEGSMDPDGTLVGYFWDFGDGAGANGNEVNHTYTIGGIYNVQLTVMDDDGMTATINHSIEVLNRPPEAVAVVVLKSKVNDTIMFDATGSSDPDGLLYNWLWEYGDETNGEGREAYHRYTEVGSYNWKLIVIDDAGDTAEWNGTIHIDPIPDENDPNKPSTPEPQDEEGLLPGPGAVVAVATMAIAAMVLATRRRRSSE
jgi:PKD repeat protein